MRDAGLKEPQFEMTDFFRTVFYRNPEYALKQASEKVVEKLSTNQQMIIEAVAKDPAISAKTLADMVGISTRKIQGNIAKLKSMGVLKRIGPDKGGHWTVVEK
ncbi:MAG: winged helix-turn-helix transcriptional regulator [Elusimicrobia bacterium]|nr:winged helix-turn-helix transcriptional regulator [Elusimicrobiota bacterium]